MATTGVTMKITKFGVAALALTTIVSLGGIAFASSPVSAAATYSETTGGVSNTWTNPSNAGGYAGSQIGANQTVQIACKLQGFQVADGNTWWYLIASSPWNYGYYVSADPFYNNGQTSGSLHDTPFVDSAVPDCGSTAGTNETTGGVAHTWTDPSNAGGTEGPQIPSNATVQIACKITGFRVADDNTWWYQVASAPWNNGFYVSADAFYNNGSTSGSLVGTPFVDLAVPDCAGSGGGSISSPSVTLVQGPAAPAGYRYAISLSGFAPNSSVGLNCYDSVSPGGFYPFSLTTNASGAASTQSYCYSGDGPDHWVIANGRTASNHVSWGTSSTGGGGTGGGGGGSNGGTGSGPSSIGLQHNASWAGYAASGSGFTYVHGKWQVPKADCSVIGINVLPGQLSQWVGIDGFANRVLLQAGVVTTCVSRATTPTYSLFWEALPQSPVYGSSVKPGDTITVDIRYHGAGSTRYSMAVSVNGVYRLSRSGTYAQAAFASAECIVEDTQFYTNGHFANVVPYPNYGTATFTSCSAARNGATSGPQIAAGGTPQYLVTRIVDDLRGMKADVSLPSSGGSRWSVYWRTS